MPKLHLANTVCWFSFVFYGNELVCYSKEINEARKTSIKLDKDDNKRQRRVQMLTVMPRLKKMATWILRKWIIFQIAPLLQKVRKNVLLSLYIVLLQIRQRLCFSCYK